MGLEQLCNHYKERGTLDDFPVELEDDFKEDFCRRYRHQVLNIESCIGVYLQMSSENTIEDVMNDLRKMDFSPDFTNMILKKHNNENIDSMIHEYATKHLVESVNNW